GRQPELVAPRFALGTSALELLEAYLDGSDFLVGGRCTIADVSNFAYAHVAPDAGYDLAAYPAVSAWIARIELQPRFLDDFVPYPENAKVGHSRSIYDP